MASIGRNPKWLYSRDVEELTGLQRQTVTDLCRTGVLKSSQDVPGGWHRIEAEEARAFAELVENLRRQVSGGPA